MTDLNEIFPPFEDFKNLVNTFNFSEEAIKLQSETALTVGYDSLTHYLQIQYYYNKNLFDWKKIVNELGANFEKKQELSGNINLLLDQHNVSEIDEELSPIFENVKKLPIEIQTLAIEFERKLRLLFFNLAIEIARKDKKAFEFTIGFTKDIETQLNFINKNESQKQIAASEYLESLNFPNANSIIKNQLSSNYYFPEKTYLLKDLYTKLIFQRCIKPNEDFEATFELEYKKPNINSTTWLLDTPKLLYFIYKLNDNKIHFGNKRIDEIAFQLFDFEKSKSLENIQTTFASTSPKFDNKDYQEKKLNLIDKLFA